MLEADFLVRVYRERPEQCKQIHRSHVRPLLGTLSDLFRMLSPSSVKQIPVRSSLQLQLLSRISQIWLPVDSKSTDPQNRNMTDISFFVHFFRILSGWWQSQSRQLFHTYTSCSLVCWQLQAFLSHAAVMPVRQVQGHHPPGCHHPL